MLRCWWWSWSETSVLIGGRARTGRGREEEEEEEDGDDENDGALHGRHQDLALDGRRLGDWGHQILMPSRSGVVSCSVRPNGAWVVLQFGRESG